MHRTSISILGTVAITVSGCSGQKENKVPIFESTPKPDKLAKNSNLETGTKLVKLAQYPLNTQNIPALIPSTDIKERLKEVEHRQSGSDPFAPLFTIAKSVTKVQKSNPSIDVPTTALKQNPLPQPTVQPPLDTDTAKKVLVQGVMQIGEKLHAIIRLPEDRTSRYVSEGEQYGNISIKRIEIKPDSEPLVIFEENGVEVAKAVDGTIAKLEDKAETFKKSLISLNTSPPKPEAKPKRSLSIARSPVSNQKIIPVPSSPLPPINNSLPIKSPKRNLTTLPLPTITEAPSPLTNQLSASQLSVSRHNLVSQLRRSSLPVLRPSPLLEPGSHRINRQKLKNMLRQPTQVQTTNLQQMQPKMSTTEHRQELLNRLRQPTLPKTSVNLY